MIGAAKDVYLATRKKHDLVFNLYVMRPLAALLVVIFAKTPVTPNQVTILNLLVFVVAGVVFVAMPSAAGALVAVGVLEASYCLDCVDGMLARYKKIASKTGHLFDFFTDELKAVILVAVLALRLYRTGGLGLDLVPWAPGDPRFLMAGIAGTGIVASAISLTNFVRRPELSGKETTVEAHYEAEGAPKKPTSPVRYVASLVLTFLRFVNHYPSHIWLFALVGRLDVLFWIYVALNLMYLAKGWLGIVLRFGRFGST